MVVENDYFLPFSRKEYDRRRRMLRDAMRVSGLDCLLIYGAHSFGGSDMGHINSVYLACYAAVLHSYIVFPLNGEPTLIISVPVHLDNARELSVISDVRASGLDPEFITAERIKELGLEKPNIGIVGPTGTWFNFTIPIEHYAHFTKTFPDAKFQTVTSWYENLRLVKSEEEILRMEKAGIMNGLIYDKIVCATKPGIKHSELSKITEETAAHLGGKLPFPGHVGSTPMANPGRSYPDFYPTHKTINTGDLVQTETSVGYGGYFTKIWGTFFIGQPTSEYKELFALASSVHDTAIRELEPGMTGRDAKKYVEPIRKAGYTTRIPLVLGWSTYNHPPSIGALDGSPGMFLEKPEYLDFVFKTGHCVDIVAWPTTFDLRKGLWLGSTCVFTKEGLRELPSAKVSKLRVV
ncbi:M24 family metallopeptidase [Chloroflexota bacterium]